MANKEHLAILKQGVEAWNTWRKAHPEIRPSLHSAKLTRADLSVANLSDARLTFATLREARLRAATLSGADLSVADLRVANLSGADLSGADLSDAHLSGADLSGADLSGADLHAADLRAAKLHAADLTNAYMGYSNLAALDLSQVKALETVVHMGPSSIGIDTIYKSRGQIPEVFLRGCGVPENFIEYMHSLTGQAFVYYSCFISHSSKDKEFTKRLYNDLQGAGVRCWLDSEDLKTGDKFWERIDESIRLHDKLLVILSEHSIESSWVEHEVMAAMEKEHRGQTVLFPIRLDNTVIATHRPWAASLRRERHITDFSGWKDHDNYQKSFERLLRDLKAASVPS